MAKRKSYAERMQEKYGIAPASAPGISGSTKGNSTKNSTTKSSSAKNSSSSLKGSKESTSYLERMAAKYGDATASKQPAVNVQKQRDTVQSVIGTDNIANANKPSVNKNSTAKNTSTNKQSTSTNKLTKGTKVSAADAAKFAGQTMQNLDTDSFVQNQVDSVKKPTVSETIKNNWKVGSSSTKPLGSYISTALESSGNPTGKNPDSLYRTDDMAADTLNAYREAAKKDAKNPLNQAANGGKGSETYNYMSDAEKNRYNEIYGVYGSKQAEEYKALMEDVINERIGQANYKNKYADSNVFNKAAYQLTRGFGSGVEGLARSGEAFIGLTNPKAQSAAQYTAAAMRNDANNSKVENVIYDIANSTGYMLPGIAASAAAAPIAGAAAAGTIGNAVFALAQYGNTYRDDINAGRSAGKAQLHALQQGVDELATNWLLGGIGAFGGGTLSKVFKDTAVGKAFKSGVSKLTSNPTARKLLVSFAEYLTDAGSEAAQEYTQYYTNAITENLLFNAGNDLSLTNSDAWYSALLGGLNAMALNAPNYASRTAADVKTIREGMKPEFNTSEGLTALAESVANNDAVSENESVHAASNETFDKIMEMNDRIENGQKVSAIEKGEAAIAARNIEAVSKMETTMRNAVEQRVKLAEQREKAAEEREKAAARETDADKIADNKESFKEYIAENAAGLYSEESRNNMVRLYDGTVTDAEKYRNAYQRAYAAGFNNIDEKTAYNSMNMLYLNNQQKLQAYKDGMRDSNLYANKKLEYEQGEAREGGFTEGMDKVDEGTGKFLDWVGKKTGVKIQIAEGLKGAAEINLDKGVMKINPYSENFVGSASHELTHLIKLYDRKAFDKLQKITVESLMKSKNMSYEALYASYEKKYTESVSSDYTVEDILEEITADGATSYLNDADFAERVVKEDSRLGKRIADFFREIADTLKAIINEKGIRAVGRVMRENEARYRTAANIWYQALENAGEKYKAGYTVKAADTDTAEAADSTKYQSSEDEKPYSYKALISKLPMKVEHISASTTNGDRNDAVKVAKSNILRNVPNGKNEVYVKDLRQNVVFGYDALRHGLRRNLNNYIVSQKIGSILANSIKINELKARSSSPNGSYLLLGVAQDENNNLYPTIFNVKRNIGNIPNSVQKIEILNVYSSNSKKIGGRALSTKASKLNASTFTHLNTINIKDLIGIVNPEYKEYFSDDVVKTLGNTKIHDSEYGNDVKFQAFNDPVEYTKNLIAVRNVSSDNLASMLELEGMPSPSIAITKDSLGHTQFGDVTFIFGRDTIDPEADSRNMVWNADAWTPTFQKIDYEYNQQAMQGMYSLADKANGNIPTDYIADARAAIRDIESDNLSLEQAREKLYDDISMKAVYLAENGKTIKMSTSEEEHSISDEDEKLSKFIIDKVGEQKLTEGLKQHPELKTEIREAYAEYVDKNNIPSTERRMVRGVYSVARDYAENGKTWNETTEDKAATDAVISKQVNESEYHAWIDNLTENLIADKGIRNNKNVYTDNGNRRSFKQLHYPVTAENIVKALWEGKEQGAVPMSGYTARSIRGASTRKFGSVAEMHEQSDRLQNISDGDEFSKNQDALLENADTKLQSVRAEIYDKAGVGILKSDAYTVAAYDRAYNDSVLNAATKAKNPNGIIREFAKNNISITKEEAEQLFATFDELRNLPTDYFEAKAKRVVGWDEVKLALVPDDIDAALIEQMKAAGVTDIRTYPAGDNAARAEMESKADNLKFQLNIDDDPEWNYYANMVQDANAETRDAADTLGTLLSSVDYMPSNKAIERTAKRLKKYTATDTSLEDITGNIKTIFNYIANTENIDGREISAILADYAGELITNSHKVEVDPAAERTFREFRNAIKGQTFHMPKGFDGELETLGGIRQIRSRSGLAINITKDKGVPIDTLYEELCEKYPGYFDRDVTNPADQLERIIDTYTSLRPKPQVSYADEKDYDAYRYYAGQEVFKAYIEEGINEAGHKDEYRALQRTYNKKLKENEKTEKEMAALQAKATEMQAKYLSELEASKKKIDKQTSRERVYEARKSIKTRYWKDQIMKDAKELSNWLLKPTDKKHVPEALREPLANFLSQLDFTSLNLAADGEPTQRSVYWMKLRDTWSKIAKNGGMAEGETGTQYMVVDTDILEKMSLLTDKIKDIKKLEELEYLDVLRLSDVMKAMKHSIETANQMIALNRSVESVATGTMNDLKEVKDHKNLGRAEGFQDMMTNRMLDADTRFHTFGKNAEAVYKEVRLGMNKKIQKTKMSADWFTELMQKVTPAKKDWTGKLSAESTVRSWSKDKLNIKLSDGTDMQLTVAQAMNLYNLLKRDQARDHILRGGITLTSIESDDNIIDKALKAKKNPVNVHVTERDCLNIINALTAEQKQFADGLANTLQKAAQWGNETSMELMGYKKFNDKFYWPIKSSRDYIATSMDDAAAGGIVGVAVKNAGPTKNVVKHANNPILVGDVIDVWSEHINFMANYNAFTIPLTDMVKWYNYVDYGDFREEPGSNKYKNSVKQELRRAYGTGADQFIMRFIEQINGSGNRKDSSPVKALISAFKGSAVGFNLSVVIQQPTAIARAGAVIEGKYLTAGLAATDTANWETIKKYSAIAQWKDWGFFDTDTGKSMKSLLTGQDTLLETLNDKQMWMAGKADEITWNRMWAAAELKVRAEHKELAKGSDAYYKKTAEIFDEIIDKTQVVDSVFTKSDLMRSENELNRLMTSFFAEPTKSYNMMYRAWFDWHVAKDAAAKNQMAKQFARAAFCWTLSNVLAAMAKSIITTMRDKDEDRDKAFWDRWLEHTWDEIKGNMAPWNYIPWVKDVASIFEGYSVTRPDTEFASDLYYVAQRWQKYFDGESKYTLGNNILYSAKLLSSMTGVAWYSAQRDANGLIDTIIEVTGADELNYQKQKLTGKTLTGNVAYYLGKAMTAYKNDHKGLGDQIISDMIKAGVPEDKIEEKQKEMLKTNEDMQSLIEDTLSGNDSSIEETRAALVAQGYTEDMIDSRLKSGISSYMEDKELTYEGVNEVLDGITDYTKAGFKEFDAAYKEWAELAKLKNGWDDKKCREQFRSQCTKYFKPKYQEGNSSERSRILNILSRAKSTDGTKIYAKEEDIKKWGK